MSTGRGGDQTPLPPLRLCCRVGASEGGGGQKTIKESIALLWFRFLLKRKTIVENLCSQNGEEHFLSTFSGGSYMLERYLTDDGCP